MVADGAAHEADVVAGVGLLWTGAVATLIDRISRGLEANLVECDDVGMAVGTRYDPALAEAFAGPGSPDPCDGSVGSLGLSFKDEQLDPHPANRACIALDVRVGSLDYLREFLG